MKRLLLARLATPRQSLVCVVLCSLVLQSILPAAPLFAGTAPRTMTHAEAPAPAGVVAPAETAPSIVLTEVVHDAGKVVGIAAHATSNNLVAAIDDASGRTLELIDIAGARRPFSTLSGIADPVIASSAAGDVYVASGGVIARVAPDGTPTPSFATMAGEIAALHVDAAQELIAATAAGVIWRVSATGVASQVAEIGKAASAVITVPDDEGRYGAWAGAILVAARDEATLFAIDAAGVVEPFAVGLVARDLALVQPNSNFYGSDRAAGVVRGARAEAFAAMEGDIVVAQHEPGVLARVRWNGSEFETIEIGEAARWDRIAFAAAGVAAIPPARRIYDAIAVVRHAPLLDGGRIEGALWQLTAEDVTLDGTDTITSDLLMPGTPSVVLGSGKPSFAGVITGSDAAGPTAHTLSIRGNASLRHLINRTDPIELAPVIPPPAPTGTRDVTLTSAAPLGDFATLRNLSIAGKTGEVAVPAGTYGRFTVTGRNVLVLGAAGTTSTYNLERVDLSGGSELRVLGDVIVNLRDGITVTGSSAGNAEAPARLVLNVAAGDVRVSGTGVLNALVRAPGSLVTIEGNGRLRGSIGADRLAVTGNGVLQVTQTDVPPPPINRPPSVDAGADQMLTLPTNTLRLAGSVTDDALPRNAQLTIEWTRVSGPDVVVFTDASAAATSAQFTVPGTYVLRLTADDGALRTSDDVTVTVIPENVAPVVFAGPDQRIELPSAATLAPTVSDDGLPVGSTLTTTWSRVEGPGTVKFDGNTATFSDAGVYTLRLAATDGEATTTDDVVITVDPENQAPAVDAGDDQTVVLPDILTLRGTATDDGWPHGSTLTTKWSVVTGGDVVFSDDTNVLTTATFATPGTYVLRLSASDTRTTTADDVTITVLPANVAPVVNAGDDQTIELPNGATLFATIVDEGDVTVAWTKVSGPGDVLFANAASAQTTATFSVAGTYVLAVTADDGELSASDQVTITVLIGNRAPIVDAGPDQQIQLPATATLSGTAADDGKPVNQLTYAWSVVSGGSVHFENAASPQTVATFAAPGTYVLRLTVDDSDLSSSDDVTIAVAKENTAPTVRAGPDQTISGTRNATLSGEVADDGPVDNLTVQWSLVSGPGSVAFADASSASTVATFPRAGIYVLRLTANDGALSASDDVKISVANLPTAAITVPGVTRNVAATRNNAASIYGGGEVIAFSSETASSGLARFAFDDHPGTRWRSAAGQLENQFITFRLGGATAPTIDRVRLLNGETGQGVRRFRIEASSTTADESAFATVVEGELLQNSRYQEYRLPQPLAARYLRFVAVSAWGTSIVSMTDIMAIDANASGIRSFFNPETIGLGHDGTVVVDASYPFSWSAVNDLHPATGWYTQSGNTNQHLTVRLPQKLAIESVRLLNPANSFAVRNFRIEVSTTDVSAESFTTVFTGTAEATATQQTFSFPAVDALYVKLFIIDNYGQSRVGVHEFQPVAVTTEPITVSSYLQAGYTPDALFDDNTNTRWTTYSLLNSDQFFIYTLAGDEPALVESFAMHASGSDSVKDFEILVSPTTMDPDAFTSVISGQYIREHAPVRLAIPGGPLRARHVKFVAKNGYGSTTSGISMNTFEVHTVESEGNVVSAPTFVPRIRNTSPALIANGATVVSHSGNSPAAMLDYVNSAPWSTNEATKWATIALAGGGTHILSGVRIGPRMDNTSALDTVKDFEIWVSSTTSEDAAFTKVLTGSVTRTLTLQRFDFPGGAVPVRYIRYVPLTNHGAATLTTISTGYFDVILGTLDGGVIAASSHHGANLPEGVLDANGSTNWVTASGAVTDQWIKLGFEGNDVRELYGVTLRAYSWYPIDFEIRVSTTTTDDSAFTTVYSGKYQSARTAYFFSRSYPARYVQFFFKNSTSTSFLGLAELNTYTVPEDGGALTGLSSAQSYTATGPSLLTEINGRYGPWTALTAKDESATVALPYGRTWLVDHVLLQSRQDYGINDAPREFELQVSATDSDPASFVTVYSGTIRPNARPQHFYFDAVPARFVRLVAKNNWSGAPISLLKILVFSPEIGSTRAYFSDASVAPGAEIVDWLWSFGDGAMSRERDPRHEYAAAGTYDVTLTVTDTNGVSTSTAIKYLADGPPRADFDPPLGSVEGTYVSFTDLSTSNRGPISSIVWDFADDTPAVTTTHTTFNKYFYDSGELPVTLTVANARGTRASVTKTVSIANAPPTVSAGPDATVRWGDPWTPASKVTDPGIRDQSTLVCRWDFGDGTTAEVAAPCNDTRSRVSHTFPGPGIYEATLTATDKEGGVSSDTVLVSNTGKRSTLINYSGAGGVTPGEPLQVAAKLRDLDKQAPIAGRTIVFESNGQSVSAVTGTDGEASALLPYDGSENEAVVTMRFDGDDLYFGSTTTKTLRCPPIQQPLDIAFVFDASGSMDQALAVARTATVEIIDEVQAHDQISIIRFADTAQVLQPLTLDREAAVAAVAKVEYFGGTNIYSGVEAARLELTSTRRNVMALPVMIVLSDGEGTSPATAAAKAKQGGIRIISVYFQPPSGFNQAGYNLMAALASSPSDLYVANTPGALDGVYSEIFGAICTAANAPPLVDAGPDVNVMLPEMTASLSGTVVDDGLPPFAAITTTWSLVSGPGTVAFANASAKATTATFSAAGTYVLELTASDTQYTGSDTVTVRIAANAAPVVDAGADQTIALPANVVTLAGTITDDGLPPNVALTSTWTRTSGPGNVTFADATAATTTATFAATGVYTLTLTASDSLLTASDSVTITVQPPNDPPVVSAGADQSIALEANLLVNGGNEEPSLAGWTTVSGSWTQSNERVLRGASSFTSADATAELRQDVDVSAFATAIDAGTQQFAWSAFVRAANESPVDTVDVIVEYRNGANTTVLGGYGVTVTAPTDWLEGAATNVAPAGTRWIRVRLVSTRNSGTTTDVSVDAVSLRALGAAATVLAGTAADDGAPGPLTTTWSAVTNAANVTFADPAAVDTRAAFSAAGGYTLRLTATDTVASSTDDMSVTVAAANQRPVVDAGADFEITLPASASLNATVTDDGAVITRWEQISGPAAATIADAASRTTSVTFTAGGTYRFRIAADDGDHIALDSVVVTVKSPGVNAAPTVNAGDDVTIAPPATSATLTATITDDDLPLGSSVTQSWSQISGPGTAQFSAATSATTDVTFTEHGIYVLRITATDGELASSDDVTVRYDGINQAPVVNAGEDRTVRLNAPLELAATVTDDNLPLDAVMSIAWSKVSGPGAVTFANAQRASTTATFSAAGDYVLRITADDSALSTSDDITVRVEDALPAPTVDITSPDSGATLTAPTVFQGTVSEGAAWRLEYRLNDAATTAPWTTIASGTGAVNGALGTFDPTLLLNGTYRVRLVATASDGQSDNVSMPVAVEGELKVGLFTLSFTDLDIPAPGLPLEIKRTYDSRDKASHDFGFGWSLGLSNVRVQKSGVVGTAWDETASSGPFPTYCLQPSAPRFITVSVGNTRTFRFKAVPSPSCQALAPIEGATMSFAALPGTDATLEPLGENDVIVLGSKPGPVTLVTADLQPYDPTRFRLRFGSGISIVFDETRGVESITDRNGNKMTVTRDGILHSNGSSVAFTRDAAGRITAITDPAGGRLTYTYDARGDLVAVTDQENATSRYVYNSTHDLVEYFDSGNRRAAKTEYDQSGRVIAVTDADGKTMRLDYDSDARREVVTDRKGRLRIYEYDQRGGVVSIKDSEGNGVSATYDAFGNVLTQTNRLGHTLTFTYDSRGNMLTETDHEGRVTSRTYNAFNQLTSITDPNNHTTTYEYDAVGNRVADVDAAGNRTTYTHDARGNVLTVTQPDAQVVAYTYDAGGQVVSETNTRGKVTTFTYDALGRTKTEKSPKGHVTEYIYDATGRRTAIKDARGNTTKTEFDEAGDPAAIVDAYGGRTETVHNGKRNPLETTFADGNVFTMSYDAEDNLVGTSMTGVSSTSEELDARDHTTKLTLAPGVTIGFEVDARGRVLKRTDARGTAVQYTYDSADRVLSETDVAGRTVRYEYDGAGNVKKLTDPNQHVISVEYDEMNRPIRTVLEGGATIETEYDWRGEVTMRRDAESNVVRYAYDGEGNLISVTEPNDAVTTLQYDDNGNRIAIVDAEQRVTKFEYDELDRPVRRLYPDGTTETITYSGDVRVESRVDRAGRTTTYEYDAMNRVTKTVYPDGSAVSVTWTASHRRDLVTDAQGVTDYDYDPLGNLTSVKRPDGTTTTYTYDAAGNRTSMTTPAGTTTYEYDASGRFARVIDPKGQATAYTYDPSGNLTRTDYANGMSTRLQYDARDQVTAVTTTAADGTVLFHETYDRDLNGNLTKVTRSNGSYEQYGYDALLRLTSETHRGADDTLLRSMRYTYDALGNRQTLVDDVTNSTKTYGYDTHDRLLGDGSTTYAYNAVGDVITTTNTAGSMELTYDVRNRLTAVERGSGTVTYAYDADGNRVSTSTATGTVEYVVDTNTDYAVVVAERDAAKQLTATYTYGHGLVSMSRGGEEYYYIIDGRGSVRALVDSAGNVTDRYSYTAFGELAQTEGTTVNPYRYAGERHDAETGLYYLRTRYYEPAIGRFLQRDSFPGRERDPRSLNRYVYAINNPTNLTDPSGRDPLDGGAGDAIGRYYIGRHGDYFVTGNLGPGYKRRAPNRGFDSIRVPARPGWGAYDRNIVGAPRSNKAKGGQGVRVDLRHYATGDVYEIKPMTLVVAAVMQAITYAALLNAYEEDGAATGVWLPGAASTFPAMVTIGPFAVRAFPMMPPGAVVYTNRDRLREDLHEALKMAPAAIAAMGAAHVGGQLLAGARLEWVIMNASRMITQAVIQGTQSLVGRMALVRF